MYSPVDVTPSNNWLPYSLQNLGSDFKFAVSLDRGGSSIPTSVEYGKDLIGMYSTQLLDDSSCVFLSKFWLS